MQVLKVACVALLLCVGLSAVRAEDTEETDEEIAADFETDGASFVETGADSNSEQEVDWNSLPETGTLGLSAGEEQDIIADALEMLEIDFINNYGTHEDVEQLTQVLKDEDNGIVDADEARFAEKRRGGGGGWRGAMSRWAAANARRGQQAGNAAASALAGQGSWRAAGRAGRRFFRGLGSGVRQFADRAGRWLRDRFGGQRGGGGGRLGSPTHPVRCRDGTWSQAGGHRGACSHHGGIDHSGGGGGGGAKGGSKAPPAPPAPAPAPKKGKKHGWFGRLFSKIRAGAQKLGKAIGPKLRNFVKKIGRWGSKQLKKFFKGKKPGTVVMLPGKGGAAPTPVIVPAKPSGAPLPAPSGAIPGMPVPKTAKQLAEEARAARRKARQEKRDKLRAEREARRLTQRERDERDLAKWLEEKDKKIADQEERRLGNKRARKNYGGIRPDLPDSEWRPHTAAECEDCMACRYVWKQVEMDVGNTQIEENVYDSFTANALEAQKTPIFYPGVQSMFDQIDDMLGDYMKGLRVDHMCENAMMCRLGK